MEYLKGDIFDNVKENVLIVHICNNKKQVG